MGPNGEHSLNGEHSPKDYSPNGYSPIGENSLNGENSPGNYFGLDDILSSKNSTYQNSTFQNSLENTSYHHSYSQNTNPRNSDFNQQNNVQVKYLRSNSIPHSQQS